MRIKIEKDCKGNCLNICPKNVDVRVGSHYCMKLCKLFETIQIVNNKEEIVCNFDMEKNK